MPEDLLLELETTPTVATSLKNLEDLVRDLVLQIGAAAEGMKGSARCFENTWRTIVLDVAKGKTDDIQASRSRLLNLFEKRLEQLKYIFTKASGLAAFGGSPVPQFEALVREIEGMERLKAVVFDRWQSADDLEKLAVEHYPLSQSQLTTIASMHAPPADWFQGEEEQLFQE
jgi:hypothetical protein